MRTEVRRDRHGVDVFRRGWPHDVPAAVVAISHGASEHSGRYDRFGRALVDAGFEAWALDHRGHGRTSDATGCGVTGAGGGGALVDDLDELIDELVVRHPTAPAFLFGHSMGSTIALAYATHHATRLAGLVLCGFPTPVTGAAELRASFELAAAPAMRDVPMPSAFEPFNEPFEPARTPFDWLSRDDEEVDRYLADELCGEKAPLTYGYVLDVLTVTAPALDPAALARVTCPVLVIAGDRDPAAGMGAHATALADALRRAGATVDLQLYEGARHELLNETNRDEVTADIVRWIRGNTP